MFKKNTLLTLILVYYVSFSQEQVAAFSLGKKKISNLYQIVDNTNKETTFFFIENKNLKLLRMDSKMQILDSMKTEKPSSFDYQQILGDNGDAVHPILYFSSTNKKKITSQSYNFTEKKKTEQFYNLSLKNEVFIKSYSKNNKAYLFSVVKNSNILKIYLLDETGTISEKSIDMSKFTFQLSNFSTANFYEVLAERFFGFEDSFSLQDIDPKNINSLTLAGKKRKCYFRGNQFIITLDTNFENTQIITIDLDKFTASQKFIEKPHLLYSQNRDLNSNSFLIDNLLYQIKCSKTILKISIKDLDNNLINDYTISEENPIVINNSPIYSMSTNVNIDKTSDFIKIVFKNNVGVSCMDFKENKIVTIGGVSEVMQPANANYAFMFGIVGAIIYTSLSDRYVESINPYANRVGAYTNCVFDKFGKPVSGKIPELAFDKLRGFVSKTLASELQTIYKIDTTYYFGYFNAKSKLYLINKFQD